jgi:hypothetical protein
MHDLSISIIGLINPCMILGRVNGSKVIGDMLNMTLSRLSNQ